MTENAPAKAISLAEPKILRGAVIDSFRKLDPRVQLRNPVMFVVEVGALLTTIQLVRDTLSHTGSFGWGLQITLWLWFTVVFANFAEAMAEGRGKAQADSLRKARTDTLARKLVDGVEVQVAAPDLRKEDLFVCEPGDFIAADGEVV